LIPWKDRDFGLHHHVQTNSGAYTASYPMGTGVLSLSIKPLGCEADHSHPSCVGVKNVWICTSIPPHVFMVLCLIKHQGQLYLTCYQELFMSVCISRIIGCMVFPNAGNNMYFIYTSSRLIRIVIRCAIELLIGESPFLQILKCKPFIVYQIHCLFGMWGLQKYLI
jgi:hypothetical protein